MVSPEIYGIVNGKILKGKPDFMIALETCPENLFSFYKNLKNKSQIQTRYHN